jgi:hypothetical protein
MRSVKLEAVRLRVVAIDLILRAFIFYRYSGIYPTAARVETRCVLHIYAVCVEFMLTLVRFEMKDEEFRFRTKFLIPV